MATAPNMLVCLFSADGGAVQHQTSWTFVLATKFCVFFMVNQREARLEHGDKLPWGSGEDPAGCKLFTSIVRRILTISEAHCTCMRYYCTMYFTAQNVCTILKPDRCISIHLSRATNPTVCGQRPRVSDGEIHPRLE